jgi:hypothetical protein
MKDLFQVNICLLFGATLFSVSIEVLIIVSKGTIAIE